MIRSCVMCACAVVLSSGATAQAQLTIPGNNQGTDGPLDCTTLGPVCGGCDMDNNCVNCTQGSPCTITIDMGLANDAIWDDVPVVTGNGVYDDDKWAVVYKYSSVNIPEGVTIQFENHRTVAPVVWLVAGDVTVAGTIDLRGEDGVLAAGVISEPGPGGFRGGRGKNNSLPAGSGFGPGGGIAESGGGQSGAHATVAGCASGPCTIQPQTYGSARLIPLVGGSGGSGRSDCCFQINGGAGGGALLIAAPTTVMIEPSGMILADGGNTYAFANYLAGSGGSIRVIADVVTGAGLISAKGGAGGPGSGQGRVRIESNDTSGLAATEPPASFELVGNGQAQLWPTPADPTVRPTGITYVGDMGSEFYSFDGVEATGTLGLPADVAFKTDQEITLHIETTVLDPVEWNVEVRITPPVGPVLLIEAVNDSYDPGTMIGAWTAQFSMPLGSSALQVRADKL